LIDKDFGNRHAARRSSRRIFRFAKKFLPQAQQKRRPQSGRRLRVKGKDV
jgi:hypothetical protein